MTPAGAAWPTSEAAAASKAVARAARLGDRYDCEPTSVAYPQLGLALRSTVPAVIAIDGGLLAVYRCGRRTAGVITPEGRRARLAVNCVRDAVAARAEAPVLAQSAHVTDAPFAAPRALLDAQLVDTQVEIGWRVRPGPDASARALARRARLGRWLVVALASHVGLYGLFLAAWAVVGGAAARGELDGGAVAAGVLLLLALVPLRAAAGLSTGVVTVEAGALLKRRLLGGVLALRPDQVRHRGAGQLLGVVLEAEALETLALTGGYAAFLALAEVLAAALALAVGIRSLPLLGILVGWLFLAGIAAAAYLKRRRRWASARLDLTHDLVERMVGHRTRQVQESPTLRDPTADRAALQDYERRAVPMDRLAVVLDAAVPRGWLVLALCCMLIPLPRAADPVELAAAIGGILLAFHGLEKLTYGLVQLADAAVAAEPVRRLLGGSTAAPSIPDTTSPVDSNQEREGERFVGPAPDDIRAGSDEAPPTVVAHDVSFAYDNLVVLRDVSLSVRPGDRVLLRGPSGAGKSTLAALLSGVRTPSAGSIVGSRAVTTAPQFHENHVFSASLAFNLLLGRAWPPGEGDLRAAWDLCHELGLGPLLAAMPGGLQQPVGDVGWQLSHGERSRLFVARALLCDAGVVVLDEAFAALDPEALRQTLDCVLRRAQALVVIAHD